jgi:toxin ParE1/3/4
VKPYAFHPQASEEYTQAAEYYAEVSPELGRRFYGEIERLIQVVRRQPDRFPRFNPPAQRVMARTFPYSLVYLDQPDRVLIVAVMHAKRHPNYWRPRLC